MKVLKIFSLIFSMIQVTLNAQNVQFHYDIRHTLDPAVNERNYPSLTFEYFKEIDSLGSFLFKIQSDMNGKNHNISQTFVQISQSVKFWQPPVFLSINYSGGLGVAPPSYGYYLTNAFGIGASFPIQYKGTLFSLNTQYRYNAFDRPSHDIQGTFYIWRGFFNYRLTVAGSLVVWTENRNQGTEYTAGLTGKKFAFFGDPQLWYRVIGGFAVGSRINVYYNLFGDDNELNIYPTIGTQFKF